ncbi:MAG: FtsX-like permease family protein [Gammaproteobacteria bacterium]|nr:FtsX-like permease family protein [Gammaproteobacteria bacterium]
MTGVDTLRLAAGAVFANRLRTALILVAMAIGVAAVVLLTSLGETGRRYITDQFASLGTNLIIVMPGRNETTGGQPPVMGTTPRDLTIDDALAVLRSPYVVDVAPVMVGTAPASALSGLEREVTVIGTTAAFQRVRRLSLAEGRFIPDTDPRRAGGACVIGQTVREELFGTGAVLGQWLRLGDRRCRIYGIFSDEGESLGSDFNELVLTSVGTTQALFDRESLFRILAEAQSPALFDTAREAIRKILIERHEGEEDVTIITQDSVIQTFDKILRAVTLGIGGVAAISLVVAGILIMNVMLVSVSQRTAEIGLLMAIGSPRVTIRRLFVTEAILLSACGAGLGLALGTGAVVLLGRIYPAIPFVSPWWAQVAALSISIATGVLFGVLPAQRAARLDPVLALSRR